MEEEEQEGEEGEKNTLASGRRDEEAVRGAPAHEFRAAQAHAREVLTRLRCEVLNSFDGTR